MCNGIVGLLSGGFFGLSEGTVTSLLKGGRTLLKILLEELNFVEVLTSIAEEFISTLSTEIIEWICKIWQYTVTGELPGYEVMEQ